MNIWICDGCGVDTWPDDGVALITVQLGKSKKDRKQYCLKCAKQQQDRKTPAIHLRGHRINVQAIRP